MTADRTKSIRAELALGINSRALDRPGLERSYGRVYDTKELTSDFEVEQFAAPLVIVKRKSDGKRGSLFFQHYPRYYFDFEEA